MLRRVPGPHEVSGKDTIFIACITAHQTVLAYTFGTLIAPTRTADQIWVRVTQRADRARHIQTGPIDRPLIDTSATRLAARLAA